MAVRKGESPVTSFEDWYDQYRLDPRDGSLDARAVSDFGQTLYRRYTRFKTEMDTRVADYDKLERLADGQVLNPKADLPNVSSGETEGLIGRIARNLVQNTPNVEVISKFDDDSVEGIFSKHILLSKIIGTDQYSNDMQQNLFASTKTSLTLGFDAVVPALLQDAGGGWYMKYDTIHYRDVFPEPGAKDVRQATDVFVRRYLSRGEVEQLIAYETPGWDIPALQHMLKNAPYGKARESVDHQTKKRGQIPEGYEIITWYSSTGKDFLTFSANTKNLLRIEKNKHPLKQHPVHFLVLEKDNLQPLGKSQVEKLIGRQDFQDLMLNGAMKLWYRNINPSIIGYGTVNSIPNLSPGKYTQISNPNAKIEPFEVNTGTLMQYGSISQNNLGSMVSNIGAADQQMATQAGNGMSATPQGVEAQQAMVDITTNNYQKAIESFFSHYCSYALTMYFQELKAVEKVTPTAEAKKKLVEAGLDPGTYKVDEDGKRTFVKGHFNEDGTLDIDFKELATEYWVRVVPGSLVEMEDEKQLRILNDLFVPLSQALPAIAQSGDKQMLMQATKAMSYVVGKQIELSGSASAKELGLIWNGDTEAADEQAQKVERLQTQLDQMTQAADADLEQHSAMMLQMQEQMALMRETQQVLMEKLGVVSPGSDSSSTSYSDSSNNATGQSPTVMPASA